MTEINTATIKINPVIDIEGLDASIRAAVAQALRKMADEMDTPASAEPAPRFTYVQIGGREGILDSQQPGKWSDYGSIASNPETAKVDRKYVEAEAAALNADDDVSPEDLAWDAIPAATREPALWGYHIGDRVKYTDGTADWLGERVVGKVEGLTLRLDEPSGRQGVGQAYSSTEITPA